jgi:hypothetical protein
MLANGLICVGLIIAGVWLSWRAFAPRIRSLAAQAWPVVDGKVLEIDVGEEFLRTATGKVGTGFFPFVRYGYTVNGRSYESDRITFAKGSLDFIIASNIRDEFQVGGKVKVYYNPAKPEQSVLYTRSTVGMPSRIPGLFVLFTGILLLVIFLLG